MVTTININTLLFNDKWARKISIFPVWLIGKILDQSIDL